jgi:hypothetical protein
MTKSAKSASARDFGMRKCKVRLIPVSSTNRSTVCQAGAGLPSSLLVQAESASKAGEGGHAKRHGALGSASKDR